MRHQETKPYVGSYISGWQMTHCTEGSAGTLYTIELAVGAALCLYVGCLFYALPLYVLLIKPIYRVSCWSLNLPLNALRSSPGKSHTDILAGCTPQTVHDPWTAGYDLYCPSTES